jgi:hypothetical protein
MCPPSRAGDDRGECRKRIDLALLAYAIQSTALGSVECDREHATRRRSVREAVERLQMRPRLTRLSSAGTPYSCLSGVVSPCVRVRAPPWGCSVAVSQAFEQAMAVGEGAAGDVCIEGDGVVFVGDAGVYVQFDGYAGLAQGERVLDVFVAEDVELSDFDVGRR